ncbi:MAG: 6,7-dimethyl-8-ribityllumazine synthase [Maioricimonas sp. JB045]
MQRSDQTQAPADLRVLPGDRYAVVVSRFNDDVTGKLHDGAVSTLQERGADDGQIFSVWVPGAYELPIVAERLARSGQYAAVICLGAVIQGDTDHDKYINSAVAHALMRTGQETGVPVLFGVLTCHNMDQALDRAGGKAGNKGSEAALAAIEMAALLRDLPEPAC